MMKTRPPLNTRLAPLGQAVIPLALLALVALVGGLVYHTRTLEGSHRTTAESALRDYAALAAWQYNQQAENYLESTAHITLHELDDWWSRKSTRPLPPPDSLVKFGDPDACGLGSSARFAFRIDLPGGKTTFAGTAPDSNARAAIGARFAALAVGEPMAGEQVRMFIDTVGGAARVIAFGVVRGADSVVRAVYGVEAGQSAVVPFLRDIPVNKALLPPSLLRGRPIDSVLTVQVRRADGGVLWAIGSVTDERHAAEQPMSADAGSLVTRVVVRPEAASLLIIGGVPSSRLNTLIVLLVGSIVLAGIALLQIRRGRELARLRTRFVANVSHELRTPLAQISMFSETLLLGRERSPEEAQQFMSIIFREARRLSHLVESVLRFSRSEAQPGERKFHLQPRDVALEVHDAVRAFTPLAAAAGVRVHTELEDGSIARVEPDAMRQVMLNLLDNAVKFGPEGQHVEVSVASSAAEVIVTVTDQGPGIPESERRTVFQAFAQGANSQSRTTTGAGIGLAVVADLVAAQGGRVWIEDGPNGLGARVVIALPLVDAGSAPDTAPITDDVLERDEVLITR